jgi:HlyD family secretion protein
MVNQLLEVERVAQLTMDGGKSGPPGAVPTRQPTLALHGHGNRRVFILAGALIIVLGVGGFWWTTHQSAPNHYVTAALARATVERRITATGTVNPELTIIIGSYVSGVISSMSCDYNTQVRKNQVCAQIDPRPYQAALEQAQGQLARDQALLDGARGDLQRYTASLARNAIARQTYEDEAALVRQYEGQVRIDRGAVANARINLEYTNITSPVDGTVVARNITIGQTVAASFQTPTLFLIATDLTRMQVDTNVSESDIGSARQGDPAHFTVEAFTDRTFDGTVTQVRQAPQTVQNVVTYDVVVSVPNPSFLLKPGMTATVGIVTDRRTNVLRVPDQALRYAPSGSPAAGTIPAAHPGMTARPASGQVYVIRDGKPEAVAIGVGLDDDSYTEVTAGPLSEGDQVIVGEQRDDGAKNARTFRFGL